MDSYVIGKSQCPKCAEQGKDRSKDNLAEYSDGHHYCFACGYHIAADGQRKFREAFTNPDKPATKPIVLPSDVTTSLPYEAREWLYQYELTSLDLKEQLCMWSDHWSRIIFPYFVKDNLLGWQGRYIKMEGLDGIFPEKKWFSNGYLHEIIHPLNVTDGTAVLVEDIVSAIKVSKFTGAIPLFGSTINAKHILRLKHLVGRVRYWLDPDMRPKALKMAELSNILGLSASVIYSDKDPKQHSYQEIEEILK